MKPIIYGVLSSLLVTLVACNDNNFTTNPPKRAKNNAEANFDPSVTSNTQSSTDIQNSSSTDTSNTTSTAVDTNPFPDDYGQVTQTNTDINPIEVTPVPSPIVVNPTPPPVPLVDCVYLNKMAIGARGGTGAFGNPGEALYATLTLPPQIEYATEFTVVDVEIADYRHVNNAGTRFEYGGQNFNYGGTIGPIQPKAGAYAAFVTNITARPSNNADSQYLNVRYGIRYKISADRCKTRG